MRPSKPSYSRSSREFLVSRAIRLLDARELKAVRQTQPCHGGKPAHLCRLGMTAIASPGKRCSPALSGPLDAPRPDAQPRPQYPGLGTTTHLLHRTREPDGNVHFWAKNP